MPRIRKPSRFSPRYNDPKGLYFRSLGWKVTRDDDIVQHKFYVGSVERDAILRIARLEALWELVQSNHNADLGDYCADQEQPAWHEPTTLAIAKAIARGDESVLIEFPDELTEAEDEVAWLGRLAFRYPIRITGIEIKAADKGGYLIGVGETLKRAVKLKQQADQIFNSIYVGGSKPFGGTLHAALDAYAKFVLETKLTAPDDLGNKRPTEHGKKESERVLRIKDHAEDMPLPSLKSDVIERIIHYWAARPVGKNKNPMRITTCKAHIRTFKAFLRWLKRSSFRWQMPDGLELSEIRPKYQETLDEQDHEELFDAEQVDTYTVSELATIYSYAKPLERAILLIALNCGFGTAEVSSLTLRQIKLRTKHPMADRLAIVSTEADSWIARKRTKTKKAGQWKLWPETVVAIEWALGRRDRIAKAINAPIPNLLFVTEKGVSFDQPTENNNRGRKIPNKWSELTKAIRVDQPQFRYLSFKYLRKTSGNFIKRFSDGETMGVFHARHKIVADDHADVYANRLFARVFEALACFHEHLAPMFGAVDTPFPAEHKRGGANISLGKISRIEQMVAEQMKPTEIAKALGLHLSTVYRRLPRKPK